MKISLRPRGWYAVIATLAVSVASLALLLGWTYHEAAHDEGDIEILIGDLHHLSALEWEAIATASVEPELREEMEELQGNLRKSTSLLAEDRALTDAVTGDMATLLDAIDSELALLELGDVAGAEEIDEVIVDPTLNRLVDALEEESRLAEADATFVLWVAALLLFGIIGLGIFGAALAVRRIEQSRALDELISTKDRFIATVSHELRTPLTAALGMAEILESDTGEIEPEERTELLNVIVDQTKEMGYIIEDLLVAARSDTGGLSAESAPTLLLREVEKVVSAIEFKESANVSIHVSDDVFVVADPVRLRQVVRNLLTNANRYGGDEIQIRSCEKGDRISLEISDDGPGVPARDESAIFDMFTQSGEHSPTGSVGIGLFVASQLMDLMGGSLRLTQTPEGPTFRAELATAARTPAVEVVASHR